MTTVIEKTNLMKQEEWRPISGYEGLYEVSNWGRVRSYQLDSNGKILSPGKDKGYYYVTLCKDGKKKNYTIHRLVSEAFIPNPNNFPVVNHKDETRTNNYVENLEWCTYAYNLSYGTRIQRVTEKLSIPVVQLDKNGVFIAEHESIREAARRTGIDSSPICKCCQHKKRYKSAGGFIFMFKDEYTATHQDQ